MSYEAELKEYELLTQEFFFALNARLRLFIFTITITGASLGYGFSTKNPYIFLIGPLVTIASMLYTERLYYGNIKIATYKRLILEKKVPGLNWESTLNILRSNQKKPMRVRGYFGFLSAYNLVAIISFMAAISLGKDIIIILCISGIFLLIIAVLNIRLVKIASLNALTKEEETFLNSIEEIKNSNREKLQ